jgi:hypothetical protein
MPAADFCSAIAELAPYPARIFEQPNRPPGVNRLTFDAQLLEFTRDKLDGYRLRRRSSTRRLNPASNPVSVRQLAPLLHTSFRQALAGLPLCFASLHLHQVGKGTRTPQVSRYARHTILRRLGSSG